MDIYKWLEKQGYEIQAYRDMIGNIEEWKAWHRGNVSNFHDYTQFNGKKSIKQTKHSLGMAKMVSETYADLLLNEKVEYHIGKDKHTEDFISKFIDVVDFQKVANEGIELTMALGTGALVLSLNDVYVSADGIITSDADSAFDLEFVTADKIIPLTYSRQSIQDIAFITNKVIDGNPVVYVNIHKLEEDGYVVYNHYLTADKAGNVKELDNVDSVLKEYRTKSYTPLFTVLRPNIVNTIDNDSPYGISVYHHSIDILKGLDNAYDSLVNEFILGRKRLFINEEALTMDEDTLEPRFDPKDLTFYVLSGGYGGGTEDGEPRKLISESNMTLRIQEHVEGMELMLNLLSNKTGLGDNYYSFDKSGVKTATEVVSDSSDLYRSIKKHELGLANGVRTLFRAVLELGNAVSLLDIPVDADISIDFDDSIIEDTKAIFNRALLLYNSQIIDAVDFFMITDKMSEAQALEKVNNMNQRKSLPEDLLEE